MSETCAVCKQGKVPEKCEVCGFTDNGTISSNDRFINSEDFNRWVETVVKPYRIKYVKTLLLTADSHIHKCLYNEARKNIEEAIRLDPHNADASTMLKRVKEEESRLKTSAANHNTLPAKRKIVVRNMLFAVMAVAILGLALYLVFRTPSDDVHYKQISAGWGHTVAIKTDGSLWAWGWNRYGQLGDGTMANRTVPTQIGTETNWAYISAGWNYTVAIRTDGSLWAWGLNDAGQLGDGTTENSDTPEQIGMEKGWVSLSAGRAHVMAIRKDGTLWAWGWNEHNQLGDGTAENSSIPVQIGTATNWALASAGCCFTVAIRTDGTLWAWGNNWAGQLGDGTTENRSVPVQIGVETDWKFVSAGGGGEGDHTVAIKTDGTLWAWGRNGSGQVGDGTNIDRHSPVRVDTPYTDWVYAFAGGWHSVAMRRNGSLWAWGSNYFGRLGDDTTTRRYHPIQIKGGGDWVSVSAGKWHTVAVGTNDSLWAWGRNGYSQVGDGTNIDRHNPVRIDTPYNGWTYVSASMAHTVAIRADGSLWAWGNNWAGQLGDGTTIYRVSPVLIEAETNWQTVSTGMEHTVAIGTDGSLWAWGLHDYDPDGTWDVCCCDDEFFPPVRIGMDTDWAAVSAGMGHTVAIRTDGSLWAWGQNEYGQLGDGTTTNHITPVQIETGTSWAIVSAGGFHTVAIKTDGSLWVWGGQLDDGTIINRYIPMQVGTDTDWASVSAGEGHTVAIRTDGSLWAWGWNEYGQLGDGTTTDRISPIQIGAETNWAAVSAGLLYTVAIRTDGTLWAWGGYEWNQLDDGPTINRHIPTQIGTDTGWASVSAGGFETAAIIIAIRADGSLIRRRW